MRAQGYLVPPAVHGVILLQSVAPHAHTAALRRPMSDILLMNVSGRDRPGLTASLTAILAQYGVTVLDIGQSVAVKETEVIAVEAIEGTDRMMERAGQLCSRGGWTLIKVAKPDQDMRFDVPTVGPNTIAKLKLSGGRMLVIEAGKTLIIDREEMLAAANGAGIIVLSRTST